MFTGFTEETSQFLWELSFHNERPWFLEHKEQFERCLNVPFKALAAETTALMQKRFPGRAWNCHCSRIYRDARRLYGRGPYKDHLWFVLWSDEGQDEDGPAFWFEIGAAGFEYGVGFFEASPTVMATFRASIDANPARFERIAAEAARRRGLRILGPEYRRPKGTWDPPIGDWYNRRYLAAEWKYDFGGVLLSPDLPDTLVRNYEKLTPLYEYFLEVWHAALERKEEERKR